MTALLTRRRMLDVVVVLVAACLVAWPFVSQGRAALYEQPVQVDQKVKQTAMITKPLNGVFDVDNSGRTVGYVDWDVYSSAGEGFKLVVASDGRPAMRQSGASWSIGDYNTSPAAWSVGSGERRFGFSATGDRAMSWYANGTKWRGFQGVRPLEIARRRTGPVQVTRTRLWLASEFKAPLPAGSDPKTFVSATALLNF